MLQKLRHNIKAFSTLEYILLTTITLLALYFFRGYIVRGLSGKWKSVGESFAFGRQYDPNKTTECAFETSLQKWYDITCFDSFNCKPGQKDCELPAVVKCETMACSQP